MAILVPEDQSAWVRTDIRLPNANERVLTCDRGGFIWMSKLKHHVRSDGTTKWHWTTTEGMPFRTLINLDFMPYWRPLPTPPINPEKEGNNNDL